MIAAQDTQIESRSMGHVALHYLKPNEGPLASKLLKLLGLVETQVLPFENGTHFYRFVVNPDHQARGDGIIYLSAAPPAQRKLIEAVREALHVDKSDQHPAVTAMREAIIADPEYTFHVGILVDSLEELERVLLDLKQKAQTDPEFKGRLKITLNRPRRGDAEVDARLDASPVYGDVDRYAYGRNGVQAFIETDILTSGPLGESLVLELDYVFPNRANHILSVVEL